MQRVVVVSFGTAAACFKWALWGWGGAATIVGLLAAAEAELKKRTEFEKGTEDG